MNNLNEVGPPGPLLFSQKLNVSPKSYQGFWLCPAYLYVYQSILTISVPKYDLEFMIMIAHYVKFISKVTQGIFMFLAVITSDGLWKKCTGCTHDCEASLRKALSSYLHMQLVVIMWVATRFQYHYAFCLLIDTILESLHQLIFFCNLIRKGKIGLRHKLKYLLRIVFNNLLGSH